MTDPRPTRSVLSVFLLMLFLFFLFLGFCFFAINMIGHSFKSGSAFNDKESKSLESEDSAIAVVSVEGVIMSSKKTVEELSVAEKDKSIKAIILRVDSPGGAVGPSQEIYEEIVRINKVKPIYASFGSVAASGGYYIGSATRKIYSNAGTLTGSIGVIMQFMDLSKLYEWAKLNPETIKAGKYKATGSPEKPMTEEERALVQNVIDGVHQQFMDDVKKGRGNRIKGDLKELAQGQIFSGAQAKELGLVDELAGLWEAGRKIHQELKLKEDFSLRFIKIKKNIDWADFFGEVEEGKTYLKEAISGKIMPMFLAR
ncbi:MAG: signal peptide peptidase SppA [Bacteriovoracaceae bacterium]|nr:signal peptide peptidase SppA [Bacteriovoracaceae bacterium]